jgi:hypothetical protein
MATRPHCAALRPAIPPAACADADVPSFAAACSSWRTKRSASCMPNAAFAWLALVLISARLPAA